MQARTHAEASGTASNLTAKSGPMRQNEPHEQVVELAAHGALRCVWMQVKEITRKNLSRSSLLRQRGVDSADGRWAESCTSGHPRSSKNMFVCVLSCPDTCLLTSTRNW